MKAEAFILQPGLYSTVQDTGRRGYLKYGVPHCGAMDSYASKMANLLLQNPEDAPVVEITQLGPRIRFGGGTEIAVCGGLLTPALNEKPIQNSVAYSVGKGDILSFGRRVTGCRAYLAIKGGFKTSEVLGSYSWYEDITPQVKLQKGFILPYETPGENSSQVNARLKVDSAYIGSGEIEVFPGAEFHLLSAFEQEGLLSRTFEIDKNNNRMAIQLREELSNSLNPIITGPVLPGVVQLTPSGRLIILMRDCQTTGGYPRVLQVSGKGMNKLAQKIMGDKINFRML